MLLKGESISGMISKGRELSKQQLKGCLPVPVMFQVFINDSDKNIDYVFIEFVMT